MTYKYPHERTPAEKDRLLFGKQIGKFVTDGTVPKERAKSTHKEADLHLEFCKWIDKNYPNDPYVRHEKERKRSKFLGGLMKVYNNIDGLPDFELIMSCGGYNGLYIEFKKPQEPYALINGYVAKGYEHQYRFHLHAWDVNRCAYFANDFEQACVLYSSYRSGNPLPMQELLLRDRPQDLVADDFFGSRGL